MAGTDTTGQGTTDDIEEQSLLSEQTDGDRLIKKNGDLNVEYKQMTWGSPFYTENAVRLRWIPLMQAVILIFFVSWLGFALVYYIAEYVNSTLCLHGEWNKESCPLWLNTNVSKDEFKHKYCIVGVFDFPSALLFSVETMTTIGYGSRHIEDRCPQIIFVVIVQSFMGVIIYGVLTGLVMSKFQYLGRARRNMIKFSQEAVVMLLEKRLYLVVMVSDEADSNMIGVTTDALLVRESLTQEGQHLMFYTEKLHFGISRESNSIPYLWPVCLIHAVNKESPMWEWTPEQWETGRWEIMVWIKGIGAHSGATVTARSSWVAGEVSWGRAFTTEHTNTVFHSYPTHITQFNGPDRFRSEGQVPALPRDSPSTLLRIGVLEEEK